jgi:ornithine cyclodeaminase/alanine dehydrogenase-like protein (mu-crystallin family)
MSPALGRGHGNLPETLILTQAQVAALMRPADWLEAVEAGFRALAEGRAEAPPPMALGGVGGVFHAKGATLRIDRPYAALKLNANFPGNPQALGLPTIQGAILLCDGETGSLLAVMDSAEVTLRRTAAATALAARHLARPESRSVMICGCGAQAPAQLEALREVLPLERLTAWDREPERARAFAGEARDGGMAAQATPDIGAARRCDVVVTCTTAREPFLGPAAVGRGTFIAAVGADSPHKSEIEPALLGRALVVADVLDQCATMGDLRHALAAGSIALEQVHAELADIVTGRKPGRTSADQVILFDSTGTAVQDVASAVMVHDRARAAGEALSLRLGAAA